MGTGCAPVRRFPLPHPPLLSSLCLLLFSLPAWADVRIRIEATVDEDLRGVRGTLTVVHTDESLAFVDPLEDLPVPDYELDLYRTFPGAPNQGEVRWRQDGDTLHFETRLPKRYGDVGWTRKGLMANGAWYPQPLTADGRLPVVDWDLSIDVPDGSVGALGQVAGSPSLGWSGQGQRASLAVVPDGRITRVEGGDWHLQLLTRGKPRKVLVDNLRAQVEQLDAPTGEVWGVVVEGPLRRRLSRPGRGTAYVSDRAYRLTKGLYRMHHEPVFTGIVAATAPQPVRRDRLMLASLTATEVRKRVTEQGQRKADLLRLTRWIPMVDAALYDPEMAFQSEVFKRVHPSDRVLDDLEERFTPATAPSVVVAQLRAQLGAEVVHHLTTELSTGASLVEASEATGVEQAWWDDWARPYPVQDYTLEVRDALLTIRREAPEDAQVEAVQVLVDGQTWTKEMGPGEDVWHLDLPEAPKKVRLDPERILGQTSRWNEVRPPPIRWSLYAAIYSVQLNRGWVSAAGSVTVNRADDTHNRYRLTVATSGSDWIRGTLAWTYMLGRPLMRTTRRSALVTSLSGAWKNQSYPGNEDIPYSLVGSLAWVYNSRRTTLAPLRGQTYGLAVTAGGTPSNGGAFVRTTGHASTRIPLHPRHVLAGRVSAGWAWATEGQRRLSLGGQLKVRGIPDGLVQGDVITTGNLEYRVALVRNASIPFGLTFPADLNLAIGLDVGGGIDGDTAVGGASATTGIGVITEHLGLSPGGVMLSVSFPVWATSYEVHEDGIVDWEFFLTWGYMF